MCGIIGCTVRLVEAAPLIHQGLKRLEYRGYDSAGIATVNEGKIHLKKDHGKIDEIHEALNFDDMPGKIGVGHTRWATHGAPTKENAHPHLDCKGLVAVVHNGVIENFLELKKELIDKGHVFSSKTDTEVIPHLIEEELARGEGLHESVLATVRKLRGSYSIAVISSKEPDRMICARNESPLVIGVSEKGTFCASGIPAILPFTNRISSLRNGEWPS